MISNLITRLVSSPVDLCNSDITHSILLADGNTCFNNWHVLLIVTGIDPTLIFQYNINHLFARLKCFQVLLFNTNISIQHYSLIYTPSNGSKYCYVIPIILFCIQINGFNNFTQIVLFTHSYIVQRIAMYHKNSIRYQSFIYTQLNGQRILFLTMQFDSVAFWLVNACNIK